MGWSSAEVKINNELVFCINAVSIQGVQIVLQYSILYLGSTDYTVAQEPIFYAQGVQIVLQYSIIYSGSTDCTVVYFSLFTETNCTVVQYYLSGITDCTVVYYSLFREYRLYCSTLFSIQRVHIVLKYSILFSTECTAVRYYLFRKYRMYCSTVLSIQVVQIVLNYVELELGTSVLVPPLTGIHYHRFLNIKNLQMLNNLFQFCNCPFFLNRILNVISIIPLLKDRMACPLSTFFSLKCGNF